MTGLFLAAWIGCQALDGVTTAVALRNPQFSEGNPIMRGTQLFPLKIGINVGALLVQRKVQKARPHVRLVLPVAFASEGCLAGVLNIRTMRGVQ